MFCTFPTCWIRCLKSLVSGLSKVRLSAPHSVLVHRICMPFVGRASSSRHSRTSGWTISALPDWRTSNLLVPTKRAAYPLISHSLGDDASVLSSVSCTAFVKLASASSCALPLASMMSSHSCTKRRLLCRTLRVLKLVRLRFAFRRNLESS